MKECERGISHKSNKIHIIYIYIYISILIMENILLLRTSLHLTTHVDTALAPI
jgi:hypothetical protein